MDSTDSQPDSKREPEVHSSANLPPPRETPLLRSVTPPLLHTPFRRFNYYIALLAAVLFAIYAWRIMQWKTEVGSWWNLFLGKKPPLQQNWGGNGASFSSSNGNFGGNEVERKINELASALGLPSKDLASAIADAVRQYVPPASMSSISAHQTGEAVQYLVDPSSASEADSTAIWAADAMVSALQAAVGLEDLLSEDIS